MSAVRHYIFFVIVSAVFILNVLIMSYVNLMAYRSNVVSVKKRETDFFHSVQSFIPYSNSSPSLRVPLVTIICNQRRIPVWKKGEEIYYDVGRQAQQFRVMIGTLLYFSLCPKWRVIVITDEQNTFNGLVKTLKKWPTEQRQRLQLERHSIRMPKTQNVFSLLKHYRPCAWQKMFLDHAFLNEDSVVYVDSDVLFTGPAENLWTVFSRFNETQFMAAAPEPWYRKDNDRPYAGRHGLNTGVMLLNLTRIRRIFSPSGNFGLNLVNKISSMTIQPRHDQDMLNQFLEDKPHLFYQLSFKWNFIISDCSTYAPTCDECLKDGISIVHGADASFFRPLDGKFLVRVILNKFLVVVFTLTLFLSIIKARNNSN